MSRIKWEWRTRRAIRGGLVLYEIPLELKFEYRDDGGSPQPLLVLAENPRQALAIAKSHCEGYVYKPASGSRAMPAFVVGAKD